MATALIILPDFLLILLGFALGRCYRYERGFWDGLERLIYFVLFPALLLRSLVRTPIEMSSAAPLVLTGTVSFMTRFLSRRAMPFTHTIESARLTVLETSENPIEDGQNQKDRACHLHLHHVE